MAYAFNMNSFKVDKYDRQSSVFIGLPDVSVSASVTLNGVFYIFKNDE